MNHVRAHAAPLRALGNALHDAAAVDAAAAEDFRVAVGLPAAPAGAPAEQVLHTALAHIGAADALRLACIGGPAHGAEIRPRFPDDLAAALFPD